MRTKQLISYPTLNNKKGDLLKAWYVEFSFRLPNSDKLHRYRIYEGLNTGDADYRYHHAHEIISYYTDFLKSGKYLNNDINTRPVLKDDTYRPEAQRYMDIHKRHRVSYLMSIYKKELRAGIRYSSYRTYLSELKRIEKYILTNLNDPCISTITRLDMIPFFTDLANIKHLTRKTISKYIERARDFFRWCSLNSDLGEFRNPIHDIPKLGAIVDCSCIPLDRDDRARLKAAILPRQPYLWLACELEYYCAIRPGHEIRLMRVGDINKEGKYITISSEVAKNHKTEKVDCPQCVIDLMERLGVFNYAPELYIFTRNGFPGETPLGESTMRVRFNQYRAELGISSKKTFYSWKHAGAISCAENGMNLLELRDHLRHSSLSTTEAYIRKRVPKRGVVEKYIEPL